MTDPQLPAALPPPGAPSANPPAPYGAPPVPATFPGKTMGIVAFILSLFITFFFIQTVGLVLGIVALVKSRKAGHSNGWALAAIITSAVLLVITIIVAILIGMALGSGRW